MQEATGFVKKCIFLDDGDQKYQNLSSKNTLFRKFSEKC